MGPLKAIFDTTASPRYPRQIMILTDGEVPNTDQVISFVRNQANTTRVFTFGIGFNVSHALIRGIAKVGNGAAEFVNANDRLETKVRFDICNIS
jgi:hypothetical protein